MLKDKLARHRFRLKYAILFSLVFLSGCNMKCCFKDCKQVEPAHGNGNGTGTLGGGNTDSNGNTGEVVDPHNKNANNANNNNQLQPPPTPRPPSAIDLWLVQRSNSDVFVEARPRLNPIPEIPRDQWYELFGGNVVRTNASGEAKLKFKDCEEVFLHFQDSRLAVRGCQSSVLGGANPICLQEGSVDYISNCSLRVQRTIQTGNAFVVPFGTSLNVTYNKQQNMTVLSVFEKSAKITFGTERIDASGVRVTEMRTETINKGKCLVGKPDITPGASVLGVPTARIIDNQDCAPALGPYLETIRKTQDAQDTPVVPGPLFAPNQLNFTMPSAGATSAQEVTITNQSLLYLKITEIFVAGEGFAYAPAGSDCPINQGIVNQCKIRITYAPPQNGNLQGRLRLTTNAESPLQVKEIELRAGVSTTGQPVLPVKPPTGTLPGNQPGGQTLVNPPLLGAALIDVNPSGPQTFTLQKVGKPSQTRRITYANKGSAPITITDVVVKGENFLLQKREDCLNKTLKMGEPCSVEVLYTPKSEGSHTDSIVFTASVEKPAGTTGSPQYISREIELSGNAAVPLAEPSDPELCFGRWKKVKPEEPKVVRHKQTFVLTSKRGASVPVTVSDVQIKGTNKDDFSIEENTCKGKDITGNCRITVGFSPQEAKVRKATLVITHDGKDNYPHEVQLSGVGKPRNWFLRLFDRAFADKKQTCGTAECDK
jgi:hypothetical protein